MSKNHATEKPSSEIEILPPEAEGGPRSGARLWIGGTRSVRVIKVGPFGGALLALAGAIILALGLIFFASAFLVLIPVVLVVAAISWLTGASGNPFRRLP